MSNRSKKRRPERPDDPSTNVYVSLPKSCLDFLKASEFTISAGVCEAVELLMKQRSYVAPRSPLPEGVRPLPDAAKYAALGTDVERLDYLLEAGFAESDMCAHLRCNRRQLVKIKNDRMEQIRQVVSRFMNKPEEPEEVAPSPLAQEVEL